MMTTFDKAIFFLNWLLLSIFLGLIVYFAFLPNLLIWTFNTIAVTFFFISLLAIIIFGTIRAFKYFEKKGWKLSAFLGIEKVLVMGPVSLFILVISTLIASGIVSLL